MQQQQHSVHDDGPEVLPVVIVGGGPTGLTAAALLADLGVPSLILERWADPYPQPRAVHLDDEVFRILAAVGIADEFGKHSRPARGLRLVDRSLRVLAEFGRLTDVGRHGHPGASMFDQPELEQLLRGAVECREAVTVRSDVEVDLVVNEGDAARVELTDRRTGGRQVLRAQYVLGCDGANSTVRRSTGIRWNDLGFTQRWLVVDVDTPADLRQWDGVAQVCDGRRAATFMRVSDVRYRWEFRLLDGESADTFPDLAALEPLLRPWLASTDLDDLTLVRSREYTFRAHVAQRWRDRRIFLLGDAAHLTPPFIGQGLGSGLRDSMNLAWKLAGVIGHTLPESALDTYEQERKPHVTALITLAMAIGVTMTGGGRIGDVARRIVGPLLPHLPGITQQAVEGASPALPASALVHAGWSRGRLLPTPAVALDPRSLSGTLCPNAVVGEGDRRLDDVVSATFLLVTTTPPSRAQADEIGRRGAIAMTVEEESPLGQWLASGGATAAVVRPDRVVTVAGASVSAVYTYLPAGGAVAVAG
ncbi:bifunctional 3-(3-hydroxy-phenyl)propionate/3-hydroxycinnamic acid hydroxylase [Gordonia sp. PKS22-38]|uniref:Bifunctional 3-(3-hydroxy-phenyl)propionate/3-hydroxycinnamic acid hydroxylase n=1 Tax=Gordonia prachuapensis TaxID=3115651 RepID=A0ABU7MZP4_9ACTN|nr:bifunctional 3-(3-hydroxy-phenyl)propionate/3-hydroxycinnamic acid hydroxylase [Gordonia sp. PKS22-38]